MALDTTNALVSLADAKAFLKITSSAEDSVIENFINRASSFANSYTQRLLLLRSNSEGYSGDNTDTLILKNYPITSIVDIRIDDGSGDVPPSVSSDDYTMDTKGGIVKFLNGVFAPKGFLNISVTYTAGYALASVPATIQEAVLLYIASAYRSQYLGQRFGVTSEHVGDRTLTYSNDEIMNQIKGLLNPYRSEASFMYAV
jgi:uncharacterized phiE125 gp8 family phage protein